MLLDLFGKVHDMSISTSEGTDSYKFYIPDLIIAKRLNTDTNNLNINRTGNVLKWNPDRNFPTKVLFTYTLYDGNSLNLGAPMRRNSMIISDIGTFDLDAILTNKSVKVINFSLYRLNGLEVNSMYNHVALSFISVDHHVYDIID